MSGRSSSRVQRSRENSRRTWESSPAPLKMDTVIIPGSVGLLNVILKKLLSGDRQCEARVATGLTLGASVPAPPQVAVAARAAAVIVT